MWKKWKTPTGGESFFAVRTDFEQKRGQLRTLSTDARVENRENAENW